MSVIASLPHWRVLVSNRDSANASHGWRNDSVVVLGLSSEKCVLKDWKLSF